MTASTRWRERLQSKPFQPRAKFQILAHAHVDVERIILRHVADAPPHLVSLRKNIKSRHARRAGRRRNEAGENPHGRALARAVGTEQADNLRRG